MTRVVPLQARLMPAGLDDAFSLRQRVLAGFAPVAGELWPEVRVRSEIPEERLWQRIRALAAADPSHVELIRRKHPIVYAWIGGDAISAV